MNKKTILKSTLEIQNKLYCLRLTSQYLIWTSEDEFDFETNNEGYSRLRKLYCQSNGVEVVYFQPGDSMKHRAPLLLLPRVFNNCTDYLTCNKCNFSRNGEDAVVVKISDILWIDSGLNEHSFTIYFARNYKNYKLRPHMITFYSNDASITRKWIDALDMQIMLQGLKRPKKLLFFVNPISGRGKAIEVLKSVEKYFKSALIEMVVVQTERMNHARDYLQTKDLSEFDGVICVGGDGMFSEIVHGLLANTCHHETKQQIFIPTLLSKLHPPSCIIGIIPAGSTDTTSYSTHGINDPITSALNIILGKSLNMDVGTVFHGEQFLKYCISFLGYGYYGDCIKSSEQYRWMGPLRYDYAGFKKILSNKNYTGEISFLVSNNCNSHPTDGVVCSIGCAVCSEKKKSIESSKDADNSTEGKWITVTDHFAALNCFLISCRCRYAPTGPAPFAHLGDGCADLVLVKKCTRFDYTRHLFRCTKQDLNQFDFPFVEAHRIKRFRFRPVVASSKKEEADCLQEEETAASVWNCDGEVISEPNIDYVIHAQVLQIYARGILNDDQSTKLTCFCT